MRYYNTDTSLPFDSLHFFARATYSPAPLDSLVSHISSHRIVAFAIAYTLSGTRLFIPLLTLFYTSSSSWYILQHALSALVYISLLGLSHRAPPWFWHPALTVTNTFIWSTLVRLWHIFRPDLSIPYCSMDY